MNRIAVPIYCPSCGSLLEMTETELFCRNTEDCPAQNSKRVLNFASTMKIKGLGEKSVENLFDLNLLNSIPDIFSISVSELEIVLGTANANKVFDEIQKARQQSLSIFIQALGIKSIGEVAAKAIANAIGSLSNLTIEKIKGDSELQKVLGQVKYTNLCNFLGTTLHKGVMALDLQLTHKVDSVVAVVGCACITGKLNDFPNRKAAEEYLQQHGWVVKSSVTKDVTHLICEDQTKTTSSSYKKALEKGIPIVSIVDLISP